MQSSDVILVAGHQGLLGRALTPRLEALGCGRVVVRARAELDLRDQAAVDAWLHQERPTHVVLAAAVVGGIQANLSRPADFVMDNLLIEANVMRAAAAAGVRRLLFFGSNGAYPLDAAQPMPEEALGTGRLESTSAPYAMAKLAGMTIIDALNRQYGTCFVSVVPATLYGPHDDFESGTSHVVSGLLRRMDEAKRAGEASFAVWGSGMPRREFLYVDDLVEACVTLLNAEEPVLHAALVSSRYVVNAGSGEEVTVQELAERVREVVGFSGKIACDASKPDGAPRKLLDSRRLRSLGWRPRTGLADGLRRTYAWYAEHAAGAPAHA